MDHKEAQDAYAPAHHPDIRNKEELKEKIRWLKELTSGTPVGAKIGCGDIENDVEVLAEAGADFIALDGFGGGTGATEFLLGKMLEYPLSLHFQELTNI